VIVLTGLYMEVPLGIATERADLRSSAPLMVFFAGIGLGCMFVEFPQMSARPL